MTDIWKQCDSHVWYMEVLWQLRGKHCDSYVW